MPSSVHTLFRAISVLIPALVQLLVVCYAPSRNMVNTVWGKCVPTVVLEEIELSR